MSSPTSPGLSKQEQLVVIFNGPIDALPQENLANRDIIRLWMKKYDDHRQTSWKMSKDDKNKVRNGVAQCVVEHCQVNIST
jgi:hypothetical protein